MTEHDKGLGRAKTLCLALSSYVVIQYMQLSVQLIIQW